MSPSSPRVRYTPQGSRGAKAVLTLTSGETLTEVWPGGDSEPEHTGEARLASNRALCAALHSFVIAKKAQRAAAQEAAEAGREPAGGKPDGVDVAPGPAAPAADPIPQERKELAPGGTAERNAREDATSEPGSADAAGTTRSRAPQGEQPAWLAGMWRRLRPEPDPLDVVQAQLRTQAAEAEEALLEMAEIHGYGELGSEEHDRDAWCSACLRKTRHKALDVPSIWFDAWCCRVCGVVTTRCAVPDCPNMAVRGTGATGLRGMSLPVCAEHAHEVPDFEAADATIEDLEHWADLFEYKRRDVGRIVKRGAVAASVTVLAAPAAFFAAPAVGGAVGALVSGAGSGAALSGAAASSYGLALLGGGSLAAGGLGMAGGTLVVTAAGGAAGGIYGLRVGSAYLGDDPSFGIECLRDGEGPAVVYSSGFLTGEDDSWATWRRLIDTAYPASAVYRVRWGARQRRDIAAAAGEGLSVRRGLSAVGSAGLRATRLAARRLAPFGVLTTAAEAALNPWSLAQRSSSAAGTTLAAILRRTENEHGFVLVGHSLGAALMATALIGLGADEEPSPVVAAHLLGAAFASTADCARLASGARGTVLSYFSRRDKVLANLYRAASGGGQAAGAVGFRDAGGGSSDDGGVVSTPDTADAVSTARTVLNIDVTDCVPGHADYVGSLSLRRGGDG